MSWEIFVIINLVTASMLVPLQRLLLRKEDSDPVTFIVVSQLVTGALLLPFVLFNGFQMPDIGRLGVLMLTMFSLYALGHYVYAITLKNVEASIFTTLLNTSMIWVVLMGYLVLNETFAIPDLLGTAVILSSIFMLVVRKKGVLVFDKSIVMGLLTGLIFGVALSLWVYIGRQSDLLSWTLLSFLGTPIIFLIALPKTAHKARNYMTGKVIVAMLILGVVWAVDNLAAMAAYQRGNVTIVAPLIQTSAILSVVISIIFLHERSRLRMKIAASIVCFLGVIVLIY